MTGATRAITSDACPARANAPAATMAGSEPPRASSRTGWVPTSEGIAGITARYQATLTPNPPTQATSAQWIRRQPPPGAGPIAESAAGLSAESGLGAIVFIPAPRAQS
jgi:hypothetical protein